MEAIEEIMEDEVRSSGELLNLIEYKYNICHRNLLENFERITGNFIVSNREIEIDREIKNIQLLLFKIEMEKDNSGLMGFMTGKIKQCLNNYILAYTILKKEFNDRDLFFPSTNSHYDNDITHAINLVRNTEVDFEKFEEFIKYIMERDLKKY